MRLFKISAIVLTAVLFHACGSKNAWTLPATPPSPKGSPAEQYALQMATSLQDPYWQKRWWLEKTTRFFRGGSGFGPGENVDEWMKLSDEEIVSRLQADPRFGNLVLDFGLYYLGFRYDRLFEKGSYDIEFFSFPQAITAAKEVVSGGEFSKIWDPHHPLFAPRMRVSYRLQDEDPNMSDAELIKKVTGKWVADLKNAIALAEHGKSVPEICELARTNLNDSYRIQSFFATYGLSSALSTNLNWYSPIFEVCRDPNSSDLPRLILGMRETLKVVEKIAEFVYSFTPDVYSPQTVSQIRAVELGEGFKSGGEWAFYGFRQRILLTNSSTNMNRKRAAYALKRFFCDDLTPVGVENPKEHTDDAHGSQASCRACHYKLDPMAGFFRYNGSFLYDFTGAENIQFDDGATINLQTYLNNWRAKPGSGREWEVGYVRSPNDSTKNDYGDTLSDLHALLKRAPEVKRCLVKRMFQYFNSDDQVVDGGYLDYLTAEYTKRAEKSSGLAFQWVAREIALGKTFRTPDPAQADCYDYKPGHKPGNAPPCRVASILEARCATCHSSVYGSGNLDLSSWISTADGRKSFPHQDGQGNQLPMSLTMERIIQRLSASEPNLRMPKGAEMPSQERQELFLWANEKMREGVLR